MYRPVPRQEPGCGYSYQDSKKGLEVYQLHVAPEDMGKVIGKQGKIAKALRLVVKAAAVKANKKVSVDIV
ncbi:hypothetical protein G153_04177 [Megasphaera sp. BL7]|nr:hypothetical protein G153_04177 [Megasphaera sp. BL7]EPP18311.1 hypothetical protein NM10_04618 [Megasphaera sp. NM10]